MLKIRIITPDRNRIGNDYIGAFKNEADDFVQFLNNYPEIIEINRIELNDNCSQDEFESALVFSCDWLVIFCHGGGDWLFSSKFKKSLFKHNARRVTLYACSAGRDENSPAAKMSLYTSFWVDGHKDAGHTTSNDRVMRWRNGHVVDIKELCQQHEIDTFWRNELRNRSPSTFRFEFPLLTEDMIISSLRK